MLHRSLTLATLALMTATTTAQVVITEVQPVDGWIEIENRGASAQSLETWTVYVTTPSTSLPGTYWWPFPAGASIGAGEFVRVHWLAASSTQVPGEFWTGSRNRDFMFGLGAEPLSRRSGSVALLNTQSGDDVSSPLFQRDYMAWGAGGQARETTAILAGLWNPGTFVPAPQDSRASIALGTDPTNEPTPAGDFYADLTPSPLRANQAGANVSHYGYDCAVGATNAPSLEVRGVPAIGNADFVIRNYGTDGVLGQTLIVMMSFGRGDGTPLPIPQFSCPLWIDPTTPTFTIVLSASRGLPYTDLPLPLDGVDPSLSGLTLHVQTALGVLPFSTFDHASSAGVAITLGG